MRTLTSLLALPLLLTACAKTTELPTAAAPSLPAPLPPRPFTMPPTAEATLSNGVVVKHVANDEVPLFSMRLVFKVGSHLDPAGQEGLLSAAFDVADTATTSRDATTLARELKRLGGSVSAGAGLDSASLTASGLSRNFDAIADVFADVLLHPAFPEDEWTVERDRRIAALKRRKDDPNAIASDVFHTLLYGDDYAGRRRTAAAYESLTTDDLASTWAAYAQPQNATLYLGGDIDLDAAVAVLNAKLADWTPGEATAPTASPSTHEITPVVYFVDKPGAAQSVVKTAAWTDDQLADDHFDLYVANTAFGGAFTARINMNLREDKGYTYGARCGLTYRRGPGLWSCSTSVSTPTTGPSLAEIAREIDEARSSRPLTADELTFFKAFRTNAYPRSFETTGALLGSWADIWLDGLPTDWLERYVPGVEAVTVDSANAALTRWVDPSRMFYLVVGDAEVVRDDLDQLGLPVVELDTDGHPVEVP